MFFGSATSAVERGLHRLHARGSLAGLRDAVMYLPYFLIAGVVLFAAALGTAIANAGEHLPLAAALCLAGGLSLFFATSAAESWRYGAPWRDIVLWGPAGIALPWLLVPIAGVADATVTVAASVLVLVVLAGLSALNLRRMRAAAR